MHRKDNVMKKAIKAIVGIALALSFAVIPSAINSGDASTSSIATVSASSGYVVVRQSQPFWWNGRYCIYAVYYQGRFVGGSDTGRIG